jgi:hypothetical protein
VCEVFRKKYDNMLSWLHDNPYHDNMITWQHYDVIMTNVIVLSW